MNLAKSRNLFQSAMFCCTVLILMATVNGANAQNESLHTTWDEMLKAHVISIDNGSSTAVDYSAFADNKAQLNSYLSELSAVTRAQYNSWTKDEQLAFLINAYNAFTVELILTKYPDLDSIRDLGSFFSSPWKKEFVPLLDTMMSLDQIEHGTIREKGVFDEPRIHFAVNCASIGCPALRAEAFVAKKLEAQLESSTQSFLRDRSRNYIQGNSLYLSKIFDWYEEDFSTEFFVEYADALGANEAQKSAIINGTIDFKYTDYDWDLNDTK